MNHVIKDKLKNKIHKELQSTFKKTIDNPVVKAHITWGMLSDQLQDILGKVVHKQWFNNIQQIGRAHV